MKSIFLIAFTFTVFSVNAKTYYLSNSSGNDANAGTSPTTAWKTISKLNSFTGLVAGDQVLFNRGEVFYGSLIIRKSGSAGNPIIYGAYGSGQNPVITGFTTVSSWTNLGSNIWESTNSVSSLTSCNIVVISGSNVAMGRYPNSGYLTYTSGTQTSKIVSGLNSSTTNWTGATLVSKKNNWVIDRDLITAHSGTSITHVYHDAPNNYPGKDGYGCFIENDARTLDIQNEWYYNASSKKIRIYSSGTPSNVRIATIDTLVYTQQFDYLTFENIDFVGSNSKTFAIAGSGNLTIQNCNLDYAGAIAIWGGNNYGANSAINFVFQNNTINHTNDMAIVTADEYTNLLISHNTIKNVGLQAGMGGDGSSLFGAYLTIYIKTGTIEYNILDSIGYSGITFWKPDCIIRYNSISNYNMTKMDGGAIYTWHGDNSSAAGSKIYGNIILNSTGLTATAGTTETIALVHGIYLDANTQNVEVYGNTMSNLGYCGIYLYSGSSNNNIHDNTIYNCGQTQLLVYNHYSNGKPTINNTFTNNIFFAKTSAQKTALCSVQSPLSDYTNNMGTFSNQYYLRPLDDNLTIATLVGSAYTNMTLAQWQSTTANDIGSKKSPKVITDANDLRFEYNASSSSKTVSLDGNYIDVKNVSYNGSITLAPYTSAVLIRNGAATNQAPNANAGTDQSITLPTNTVNLSGSGTDPDGTVSSYKWTKVSGPSAGTITSASSASTSVTALAEGVYKFELKVTDNKGTTGADTVQITVNAAANVSPVANAGSDKSITLPSNTISLAGSGSDPDGTIVSYAWAKTSGPGSYNIVNPSSALTDVSGLVEGTYQFELTVTDNKGATAKDIIQVIVNVAANVSPMANAGSDKSITLPANTISLAGSGSDPDGTIASYAWAKTSGPGSYNIVNPSSPVTDVSGLVEGTYQFELTVTDDQGATAKDIVQITVNAAANIPPIANAGVDKSLTLPTNTVSLTGTGNDPDGSISLYRWKQIAGPSASSIANSNSASTLITALIEGVYQFELKVTDNSGASARDTISVTVNAANLLPVANAGADISITLPANTVSLAGSGSDPDGTIASYGWTKISGPSSYNIVNSSSPVTDVSGLVEGVYQFELIVTDNNGDTGEDILQVTVNAVPNKAPVANAGVDQSIKLPINNVDLSGSGTDADGSISFYNWKKISGPSAGTITNANSASTSVTGLTEGIYTFQLQVTDNNGATGANTVQITVLAANITPTANAGIDKSITLPINTINLSGSGMDPDGIISSYDWAQISGPPSGSIANSKIASTSVTGMVEGVYEFRLRVTDNDGATDDDIVKIVVNPEPNIAPTANAGKDQIITLPINITSLAGNGSDPDGTIVNYKWSKLSGPVSYNIVNTASPVTDVSSLSQGVYQFELKVTDDDGAVDIDTVQILVKAAPNMPPVADAGRDQAINLPVDNTMLAGTASDADGIIKSYKWSKISGPALTIVSPKLKSTTVTGLAIGTYKIELMVTDNAGATGRDTVILNVSQGTLPLNLLSFKGQLINEKVSLTWKTANERNVLGFEVERMTETKWEKIGNVKSAIGGISGNNYSFNDYKPVTGVNYYRLKIVDIDGKYVYSDIVNVELKPNKNVVYQNVPNPFSNATTIRYEIAEKDLVKIVVYNSTGAQVAVLVNEEKEAGTYQVKWDAANFSSGNYFYRVLIGDNVTTKQMIKIK
jgi:hypothetical protein